MKTIKKVCKLNFSLYFFFLLSFLCGYFKPTLLIFLIVVTHECGHIFFIKLFHYQIVKVELFAFGGLTTIEKPINSSINKEMIISLGGFFFQGLLFLIFYFLFQKMIITEMTYQLFLLYNKTIFFFNLLPIIPLDGSVFIHALLEKFYSYYHSFQVYKVISVLSFVIFLGVNYWQNLNNYFICLVLFFQFLLLLKNEKYYLQRFYLERFLNDYPYKRIENDYILEKKKLKKETKHYFYTNHHFIDEKKMLAREYDYFS